MTEAVFDPRLGRRGGSKYRDPKTGKFISKVGVPKCNVCGLPSPNHCPICHKPLTGHLKCASCTILIGENHTETKAYRVSRGRVICDWCRQHKFHGKIEAVLCP